MVLVTIYIPRLISISEVSVPLVAHGGQTMAPCGTLGPHALAPHAGAVCWPRVLALYRSPGHVQALDRRCR